MGGGGGGGGRGGITKYSRGQVHVCICDILDIHKAYACTVIIEVHADMYVECRSIYTYETTGV